jgi:hypothetical protein
MEWDWRASTDRAGRSAHAAKKFARLQEFLPTIRRQKLLAASSQGPVSRLFSDARVDSRAQIYQRGTHRHSNSLISWNCIILVVPSRSHNSASLIHIKSRLAGIFSEFRTATGCKKRSLQA